MSNPAATPSMAEDLVGDDRWMSMVRAPQLVYADQLTTLKCSSVPDARLQAFCIILKHHTWETEVDTREQRQPGVWTPSHDLHDLRDFHRSDRVPTNLENHELSGNFVNPEKSGNLRYGQGICL